MKKSEILFCVGEPERTGGLTFVGAILSDARRSREKKMDWKSLVACEEPWAIVIEKQKQTAFFFCG